MGYVRNKIRASKRRSRSRKNPRTGRSRKNASPSEIPRHLRPYYDWPRHIGSDRGKLTLWNSQRTVSEKDREAYNLHLVEGVSLYGDASPVGQMLTDNKGNSLGHVEFLYSDRPNPKARTEGGRIIGKGFSVWVNPPMKFVDGKTNRAPDAFIPEEDFGRFTTEMTRIRLPRKGASADAFNASMTKKLRSFAKRLEREALEVVDWTPDSDPFFAEGGPLSTMPTWDKIRDSKKNPRTTAARPIRLDDIETENIASSLSGMDSGGVAELSEWGGQGALWSRKTLRSSAIVVPETIEGLWFAAGVVRAMAAGRSGSLPDANREGVKRAAKALARELDKAIDLYDS